MFNQFAIDIYERLLGQKWATVLGNFSGTSERTWRDRIKHGWEPTNDEHEALKQRLTTMSAERLVRLGEWTSEEAHAILANSPSGKAGVPLPAADLIYYFSPRYGEYCQRTIAIAAHFDRNCARLANAAIRDSSHDVRAVLIDMLEWLATFCPTGEGVDDIAVLRHRMAACSDTATLLGAAGSLHEALLFHVLSCWDLEFCSGYFGETMQAHPLFELVMPRFAPDIEIQSGTGRILRNGQQPRRRIFETATARLLDFIGFLLLWRRQSRLPNFAPRVKELAAWSNTGEARLVSWRDETTRLTLAQLEEVWIAGLEPDREGFYPAAPRPMFVCTHLFSPLLGRKDGKRISSVITCAEGYRTWWQYNRDRLIKDGLRFGEVAWPTRLIEESSAQAALSSLSSQSSGRSSLPRDCQ
ncbi:hypothetical protein [Massilia sp.]|uniref:hypothetical protein n=1 Tax=Massilia sp. TaxID=1882437 RepID=UPI0028A1A610|nr:hypothetical protein [Massilia sp.]